MMTMLAGLAAAALVWWGLKTFAAASPARVARLARQVGGGLALLGAAVLAFRGRLDMAFLLGSGGAWLLGWSALPAALGGGRPSSRSRGQVSRVRSATVEMELDHDSGVMTGRILQGPEAGRPLDGLGLAALLAVRTVCIRDDPDGARLIEAYLDRRFAAWREDAEPDPDRRQGGEPQRPTMSEEEAYQVLGLQPGAEAEAVRLAHRALMKKLHPDQGGSTYLASRVNQAKDVLLHRHR